MNTSYTRLLYSAPDIRTSPSALFLWSIPLVANIMGYATPTAGQPNKANIGLSDLGLKGLHYFCYALRLEPRRNRIQLQQFASQIRMKLFGQQVASACK